MKHSFLASLLGAVAVVSPAGAAEREPPVVDGTPLPAARPADFTLDYGNGGGMRGHRQSLRLTAAGGHYSAHIRGEEVTAVDFAVAPAELDALYALLRKNEVHRIHPAKGRLHDYDGPDLDLHWKDGEVHISSSGQQVNDRRYDEVVAALEKRIAAVVEAASADVKVEVDPALKGRAWQAWLDDDGLSDQGQPGKGQTWRTLRLGPGRHTLRVSVAPAGSTDLDADGVARVEAELEVTARTVPSVLRLELSGGKPAVKVPAALQPVTGPDGAALPEKRPADLEITFGADQGSSGHRGTLTLNARECRFQLTYYQRDAVSDLRFHLTPQALDALYAQLRGQQLHQVHLRGEPRADSPSLRLTWSGGQIDIPANDGWARKPGFPQAVQALQGVVDKLLQDQGVDLVVTPDPRLARRAFYLYLGTTRIDSKAYEYASKPQTIRLFPGSYPVDVHAGAKDGDDDYYQQTVDFAVKVPETRELQVKLDGDKLKLVPVAR